MTSSTTVARRASLACFVGLAAACLASQALPAPWMTVNARVTVTLSKLPMPVVRLSGSSAYASSARMMVFHSSERKLLLVPVALRNLLGVHSSLAWSGASSSDSPCSSSGSTAGVAAAALTRAGSPAAARAPASSASASRPGSVWIAAPLPCGVTTPARCCWTWVSSWPISAAPSSVPGWYWPAAKWMLAPCV